MNELNEIKEAMNDFKEGLDKLNETTDKVIERNNKIIAGLDECSRIINEYLKNAKIKMELKDTIELMISSDYNDRFRAEYYQLEVRIDKLQTMLEKYKNNQLDFVPSCSYELLNKQLEAMIEYRNCLLERSIIEDIDGFFKIKSFRI